MNTKQKKIKIEPRIKLNYNIHTSQFITSDQWFYFSFNGQLCKTNNLWHFQIIFFINIPLRMHISKITLIYLVVLDVHL